MKVNFEIITGEVRKSFNQKLNSILTDEISKFRVGRDYQNVCVVYDDNEKSTSMLIKIISPSRKKTNLIKKDLLKIIKKIYGKEFISYCSINRFKNLGDHDD